MACQRRPHYCRRRALAAAAARQVHLATKGAKLITAATQHVCQLALYRSDTCLLALTTPQLPLACSYIYLSGKLRPVPASRAELFADKALPLASKRCLGRFLAGCLEAQQGAGRLQVGRGDAAACHLLDSARCMVLDACCPVYAG